MLLPFILFLPSCPALPSFFSPYTMDLYFFSPVHPFPFGNFYKFISPVSQPRDGFKLALLGIASQQNVLACGTCLCEAPSCCSRSSGVTLKGSPLERGCRNCSPYRSCWILPASDDVGPTAEVVGQPPGRVWGSGSLRAPCRWLSVGGCDKWPTLFLIYKVRRTTWWCVVG